MKNESKQWPLKLMFEKLVNESGENVVMLKDNFNKELIINASINEKY